MEFHLLFFASMLLFFVVFKLRSNNSNKLLPPGPWKLPLLGNLHQLIGSLPHHRLTNMARKYGPLMHIQLGEVSTIVVSSPEMAKEVLKVHDIIFSQRPSLLSSRIISYNSTNIIFSPYGYYWRMLRKVCTTELLSANRVQSFRGIREEEVSNFIRSISMNEGLPVNFSESIFSLAYGTTARIAFGRKCEDQEAFISSAAEVGKLASGFCVADMYPSIEVLQLISGIRSKLEKLHQESDRIAENIINQHKERKTPTETEEDLVDVLLRFQEHDLEIPLTNNNIKAVLLDILGAGSETSSTTIEWAMSELLKNPSVMKVVQEEVRRVFGGKEYVDESGIHELQFLKSVIKETLRLHPPAPLSVPRECSETCQINGYTIPSKSKVIINIWAVGRDPRYWTEPERFYPERFLNSSVDYKGTCFEYIPFGAGRRICPGILFALPNIELPLAQLLFHFDWKLPNGMKHEDLDMTEAFGLTTRRKHDLFLVPISHYPFSVEK